MNRITRQILRMTMIALALCMLLTGCSFANVTKICTACGGTGTVGGKTSMTIVSNGKDDTTHKGESTLASIPNDTASVPKAEKPAEETILSLYWELLDHLAAAIDAGDYEAYKALYYDTDESTIEIDFLRSDWIGAEELGNYDQKTGFVAEEQHGYYWIASAYYIVAGTHPNTNRHAWNMSQFTHYENGRLQLAYGQEATSILSPLANNIVLDFYEKRAPGARTAIENGNNRGDFSNRCYLYLNPEMVYNGSYDTTTLALWQDDAGTAYAAIWYSNGTDADITVNTLQLTITDDSLGTILKEELAVSETVRAHHSVVRVVAIPAERVLTGTQCWTFMHSSTHTTYR